jgi:hypothetical protein
VTIAITFLTAGWLALIAFAVLLGRTSRNTTWALVAAANACFFAGNLAIGNKISSAVTAATLALSLWHWWNSGGGDGTKRRLRDWKRRFEGVRRTAPVTAS